VPSKSGRFQGGEKGHGDSRVDLDADFEAIRAAAIDEKLAGATVPG
jgi:hypothetical protein